MHADRGDVGSLEHHVVDYACLVPASEQPERGELESLRKKQTGNAY